MDMSETTTLREETVLFGPEGLLVGTHAFATTLEGAADLGVLLTNAGVVSRTGPHGINVTLARLLAPLGIPSFRFDLSGLGDSLRPTNPLPAEQQFVADTRQAMDQAQAHTGVRRFLMIGFCSGADLAHLVALKDERVVGMLLWDPYIYPTRGTELRRFANLVRRRGLWHALQRGALAAVAAGRRLAGRRAVDAGQAPATLMQTRYGRSYIPPARDYGARLKSLLDRGVQIRMVYSGAFPDYNHAGQYRASFRGTGISDRLDCVYLRNCDHVVMMRGAQQAVRDMAVDFALSLRAAPPAPARP